MSAFHWKNKQSLEAALSNGLVTIAFEKKSEVRASPGNECPICKKALWNDPDPDIIWLEHSKRPYSFGGKWESAGDGVAHLACNHYVHDKCFEQFGKDPTNLRKASNPVVPGNVACPECGHSCSMWTCTEPKPPRRMTCTRNLRLVPPNDRPKDMSKHSVFETNGTVRVYEISFTEVGDVNFVGWKSFRMDSLLDAEPRNQKLVAYIQAELARNANRANTKRKAGDL